MCLSHTLRGIQAPILPLLPEHPVPSQPSAMPNGIIMLGPKMARRFGLSRADAAAIAVPRVTEYNPLYASPTTKQTKTQ
ncbi:hypothetical protein A0O28_0083490 [Trichoderma guizhouense]|uniref:Uncharacterized protein n=1 Tax=Trichoderma guizhouense TaxID=1491466 RepID=A0A1T3CKK6_9HYPO|nr:hypothetical protein A0O28_0083490 [Trichoderma guizhouense]